MQHHMSVRGVERGSLRRPQRKGPKLQSSSTAAISNLCHIEDDKIKSIKRTHHKASKTDCRSTCKSPTVENEKQRRTPRRQNTKIESSKTDCRSTFQSPTVEKEKQRRTRRAPKRHSFHALFIFDWDDTLFPTNVLGRDEKLALEKDEVRQALCQELHAFMDSVIGVLRMIKQRSNTEIKIVTSANQAFIDGIFHDKYPAAKTLQPIFGRLEKAVKKLDIQIISARDRYVSDCKKRNEKPTDEGYHGRVEKAKCMKDVFAEFKKKKKQNESVIPVVYSIGDGMAEWNASRDAFRRVFGSNFETLSLLQRIKLEQKPESLGCMQQQMETVASVIRSHSNAKYLSYIAAQHQVINYRRNDL